MQNCTDKSTPLGTGSLGLMIDHRLVANGAMATGVSGGLTHNPGRFELASSQRANWIRRRRDKAKQLL